ncbi:CaiB/BaiF CoA transferase family protein [Bordetella bronchiseptica]|uniref:CaiB/BaiF CoA transferase family protein n=1 Tax=Bordetella bronchiseptica TaxID=518 RepID=UPI00081C2EC6|nr:CaiB/BaiF CoA-transferase family protein [Bordetella bronchiseptica]AOB28834.1 carnitine dehydratase [Bordetella bronchiseptica]AZW46186.1 CoA transferase [Bordetella bronchiseptica]
MGPLRDVKIIELAGIGPCPMAAMLLADLGATVLRIDRPEPASLGIERPLKFNLLLRNRKAIALDLKQPAARDFVLRLVEGSDALLEGFRPGVTERLGLGPQDCLQRNPRLVYGRMTGWGQTGPLAQVAGHDLNYIGLTGVLHAIGRAGQPPTPPLNVVGDFGGGALYLALGVLAGIIEARQSGRGQVVDAAIVDGAASLATALFGLQAAGLWNSERGANLLDSGAYFYDVYECADGRWVSVAPLERKFHDKLLELMEIDREWLGRQADREGWPRARAILAERFKARTQAQWCELLGTADVCVAPVLPLDQVAGHPHIREREVLVDIDGVMQPAPAPRFSRTVPARPTPPEAAGPATDAAALAPWLAPAEQAQWRERLAGASAAGHVA